jgi:hypothetical protein
MKHQKTLHFLVLMVMLGLGIGAFYFVRPDRTLQLAIAIATAVGYVLWGIVHHVMEGDLHIRLVIEYILIGAIATVLLFTMAI